MGRRVVYVTLCLFTFAVILTSCGGKDNEFGDTLPEKLFSMSWEEISELSEDDFKDKLDEEGTVYEKEDKSNTLWGYKTKTTTSFAGGDCFYEYTLDKYADIGIFYTVAYETEEAFKSGQKVLEEYIETHKIEGSKASKMDIEENEGEGYSYITELSDKNLDIVETIYRDNLSDNEDIDFEKCKVCKIVDIIASSNEDKFNLDDFPRDKSYTNYKCRIRVRYVPLLENMLIYFLADEYGYDFLENKTLDLSSFPSPVSEEAMEIGIKNMYGESVFDNEEVYKERKEELYLNIYMAEKHNFNMEELNYFESDSDKKEWYLSQFHWDIDKGKKL